MTPYYQDDWVTIYHGDCRDVPVECDLVLTDPPYGFGYVTSWRSQGDALRVPVSNDTDLSVVREAWPIIRGGAEG